MNIKKANFTLLNWVALFEGTSFLLLLFVAVPLKRYAGMPELVKIVGPTHGILLVAFIVLLISHVVKRELSIVKAIMGFVASLVPFGTFVFKAKMLK